MSLSYSMLFCILYLFGVANGCMRTTPSTGTTLPPATTSTIAATTSTTTVDPTTSTIVDPTTSTTTVASTTTTTTTVASTTTTTIAATTTTTAACAGCTANDVTLIPGNSTPMGDTPGTTTPTLSGITNVNGCVQTTATCTVPGGAAGTSFMQFNGAIGSPNQGQTVTAQLVCNANRQWTFTLNGVQTVITSIDCSYLLA